MTASVEKLRWMLVAGSLLLLLLIAGFLGYGRYKQARKWAETLKRLNLHGPHETRGFTYSSSPKDRTSYKVRADRVIQHGDGRWSLYNVDVTLYSRTGPEQDHIHASDIEYDQNSGVARADGEVHMDFEAPGQLKNVKAATKNVRADAEPANVIHLLTSGLVYVRKLDVASTAQPIEIRYSGLECTAVGAEFDEGESQLRLLADVVLNGAVGKVPLVVHSSLAVLDRKSNVVTLERPLAQSRGRTIAASHAVAHLRKDGSLEAAEAVGGVTMDEGTRHLAAAAYSGSFGASSQPLAARLNGGVTLVDSSATRPMHGKASEVNALFTPAGDPQKVTASGGAQLEQTVRLASGVVLPREMHGDSIVALYGVRDGQKRQAQVREIVASGAASAREGVAKSRAKSTELFADELRAETTRSAKGGLSIEQMTGSGHTKLMQTTPQGAQQVSSGDALTAHFAANRDGVSQLANATQTGHVTVHSVAATKPGAPSAEPADATASQGSYEASSQKLTLAGDVHFEQGRFDLTAGTVSVNQATGDAQADGNVVATVRAEESKKSTTPQKPTHVVADSATMLHGAQLAEFFGTSGHPARLWQGASEVQANSLLFDQKKKSIAARPDSGGKVHAVFARSEGQGSKRPVAAEDVVRVSSSTMDYDDLHREATFTGGVRMEGKATQVQSQRAVVMLAPERAGSDKSSVEFGGQLRRVVLQDGVRLSQPGRSGTGEMLVYNATDATYLLSGKEGHPPHIVDAKQGSIMGATLLFHDEGTGLANSTIIVTGSDAADKKGRVRTEVEVRGK